MSTKTQCDLILDELKQGKSLTAMDAKNMGIMRLAARIHDLRGTHNIVSERVRVSQALGLLGTVWCRRWQREHCSEK